MEPRKVYLCGICTMPLEYCEFSGTQEKCKLWLREHDEDKYTELYGVNAITEGVEKTNIDEEGVDKKDRTVVKDKSAKLEAKLEREIKKKMASRVIIKRIERTKRKSVTTIYGLDVFGVDIKKAAKMFANRFACGSSVAKNNQGQDEIVVQGDFSDDIHELILTNWPDLVPKDNIDRVEEKKKKKGENQP
ncbi:translation initiation factor SUI1 [Gilbertella persicaria]|uniref:Translation machinery-associated protein 22 n=1 Tax=Rhizopus stolonifer TaxID=4846 RepID=A0A367JT19_RHIST|nr:translation initiation factor SUI1 [Gilbertella persicaria]KAI8080813.1 translation initiation factor SUI1 [Gilbertella persicaria]RCH92999.1 Translation machinery-associated protein 22 [Rhizopus stolonifer]